MVWLDNQVETFGGVFLYQVFLEKKDNYCDVVNVLLFGLPYTSGELDDLICSHLSSHVRIVGPYYSGDFGVFDCLPDAIRCNHHCDVIFVYFVFLEFWLANNTHSMGNHVSQRPRHRKTRILLGTQVYALRPYLFAMLVFSLSLDPSP